MIEKAGKNSLFDLYNEQAKRLDKIRDFQFSLVKWGTGMVTSIVGGAVWLSRQPGQSKEDVGLAAAFLIVLISVAIGGIIWSSWLSALDLVYRQLTMEKYFSSCDDCDIKPYFQKVENVNWLLEALATSSATSPFLLVVLVLAFLVGVILIWSLEGLGLGTAKEIGLILVVLIIYGGYLLYSVKELRKTDLYKKLDNWGAQKMQGRAG